MHRFFIEPPAESEPGTQLERAAVSTLKVGSDPASAVGEGPSVVGTPLAAGTRVALTPSDAAHAARVLRLSAGDVVTLCDGRGYEYEAVLEHVSTGQTTARIKSHRVSAAEPSVNLTLIQGLPKGSKMDLIVQKAVEVGASRIIPVETRRTVVRLDRSKAHARVERWRRIAYEAAKQAGRGLVPVVEPIAAWDNLWQRKDLGFVLIPWEDEVERGLLETVRQLNDSVPDGVEGSSAETATDLETAPESDGEVDSEIDPDDQRSSASKRIAIVIGPEGGLTPDEISLAEQHGGCTVTLGPRVLRTETAGIVSAALVLSAFGELG